jgi:hypothetical protein
MGTTLVCVKAHNVMPSIAKDDSPAYSKVHRFGDGVVSGLEVRPTRNK